VELRRDGTCRFVEEPKSGSKKNKWEAVKKKMKASRTVSCVRSWRRGERQGAPPDRGIFQPLKKDLQKIVGGATKIQGRRDRRIRGPDPDPTIDSCG